MLKETIVAVTVITMTAGASLLPTAVSAGEKPIVLASCGGCNPCNPCGACNPCGGCNPCGAADDEVELTAAQANAAYACIQGSLKAGYAKSGNQWVNAYQLWTNYAV